jgi:hypothetical protein
MADYSIPSFTIPNEGIKIDITIPQTQATLVNQGYTYNEPGLTYNQAGVMYGGVNFATEDIIVPSLFLDATTPHLQGIYDKYTPGAAPTPPSSNSGMLIGILGLTYP